MPDRFLSEVPDRKRDTLTLQGGDEAWGWHPHLVKAQLSQTFATGSCGPKRKAIVEKGEEVEVEKYTRPVWIFVHNI
jgi:hypothetical protein